jgi:HPt (histidine-containing phosphotransfer) domain-containing protein
MINQDSVNWDQLSMILGEEGDPVDEELADLFRDFIDDSARRLVELSSLDPVSEPDGVAHEAHKIRGAALSFGFEQFASILHTVETRVLELTPEEIGRLMDAAHETFERSKDLVAQRYAYLATVA